MSQYRYVGAAGHPGAPGAQFGDFAFTKFGQLVEMPDDVAAEAIAGRVALLSVAEFDEHGMTPDELRAWGNCPGHPSAPSDFKEKLRAVWARLHHNRLKQTAEPAPAQTRTAETAPEPTVSEPPASTPDDSTAT